MRPKSGLNKITLKSSKNKKMLHCKNFFIFLLLLQKHENFNNMGINIFIKKNSENTLTSLRSPYRHKLARHQFTIQRYQINTVSWFFLQKNVLFNNLSDVFYFNQKIRSIISWFETNIVYQHKITIKYNFYFKQNFIIKNYN